MSTAASVMWSCAPTPVATTVSPRAMMISSWWRSAKWPGRIVNPASRRSATDRPSTETAATQPIHPWSSPAAAAPTRQRAAARFTGRIPRTATADPPTVDRANDAAWTSTTTR